MAKKQSIVKSFWQHRILLSVAFTQTGRVRGLRLRTFWIFFIVATIAGALGYERYTLQLPDIAALEKEAKQKATFETMIVTLEEEKDYQDQQFKIFAQELGILQARLERFDLISEKLFNDREIGKHLENVDKELEGKGGPSMEPLEDMETPSLDELQSNLEDLHNKADRIDASMQAGLELVAKSYESSLQQPYLWPVVYHRTHLTSTYGSRKDPFSGRRKWHRGVDIAAGYNAPIVTSADGVVIFSGYRYGYGILVEVRHAQGYVTRYAHMNESLVKNGQAIKVGDAIGLMGSTGRSSGPHLHFEVLVDDKHIDPLPFIRGGRAEALEWAKAGGVDVAAARERAGRSYTYADSVEDGYKATDEAE